MIKESSAEPVKIKKGRKEILLKFNKTSFAAIGVHISKNQYHLLCIDFYNKVIFEKVTSTKECNSNSKEILEKISDDIQQSIIDTGLLKKRRLVGIGISINGIVDSAKGISLKSYNVMEDNVNIKDYLEKALRLPVYVTNNICALAHGEKMMSNVSKYEDSLFIKYGPGVGASRLLTKEAKLSDYKSVEIGHFIVDYDGAPCICGNQGCLETVSSYDYLINVMKNLATKKNAPSLFDEDGKILNNIKIINLLESYNNEEELAMTILNRSLFYISFAIKNIISILEPESIVLYGEIFENNKIRKHFKQLIAKLNIEDKVNFSKYNLQLEAYGPASNIIEYFLENGAIFS